VDTTVVEADIDHPTDADLLEKESALAGWSPEDRHASARLLGAFVSGWERAARHQAR
jgi:hypothetical protein